MSTDQKEEKQQQEGPQSVPGPGVKLGPDPEVEPKSQRRRFTAAYKAKILAQADACEPGTLGTLLRREGLYYTSIQKWRKLRAAGTLESLTPRKRGPAPDPDKALKQRNFQLEKEIARLANRLANAEMIIDVQKKLASLLNLPMVTPEWDQEGPK